MIRMQLDKKISFMILFDDDNYPSSKIMKSSLFSCRRSLTNIDIELLPQKNPRNTSASPKTGPGSLVDASIFADLAPKASLLHTHPREILGPILPMLPYMLIPLLGPLGGC